MAGPELARIIAISAEHEADLTVGLDAQERELLIGLLQRVAENQGLVEGVHPDFADERADLTQEDPPTAKVPSSRE